MTSNALIQMLHARYTLTLNLWRFVQRPAFQQAFYRASQEDRDMVIALIQSPDLDQRKLENWTKAQLKKLGLLEELDARYLKELAQRHGIRNYSSQTRLELINNLRVV